MNNAGIGTFKPLVDQDLESFERVFATNVTGLMLMAREATATAHSQTLQVSISFPWSASLRPRCGGRDTGRAPGGVSSPSFVESSWRKGDVADGFQKPVRRRLLTRALDIKRRSAAVLARHRAAFCAARDFGSRTAART